MMRLGVREFVGQPFDPQSLSESLQHAAALLARKPVAYGTSSQIFSFLPSKAGVGTSTLALNVAAPWRARKAAGSCCRISISTPE